MTDPYFNADLDTLKAKLRLECLPDRSSANPILDDGVLWARLQIFRRLGLARSTALKALTYNENPTTDDEVLRALANQVECKLVKVYLIRHLPVRFADSNGDALAEWNSEALFRELGPGSIEDMVMRIETQCEEDFQLLEGEESLGTETTLRTFDGSREDGCPAPTPGAAIHNPNYPFRRRADLL